MRKLVSFLAIIGASLGLVAGFTATESFAQQAAPAPVDPAPSKPPAKQPAADPKAAAGQTTPTPILQKLKRVAPQLTSVPADDDPAMMHFWGTCGASAAIRLDATRVVIASDDDNFLRTYDLIEPEELVLRDDAGQVDPTQSRLHPPRSSQNLYPFLKVNQFSVRNFSAIEGAAQGDGIVYWIGSHARRWDGETRANRRRFFATTVQTRLGTTVLEPFGVSVRDLAHRLESDEKTGSAGLRNAIMAQYRKLEHLAPEVRGLDIQGLAMAPDGETLWIALRNPLRAGRAYIVPVENPRAVVQGAAAVFGTPFVIDLGHRGISAIEWSPQLNEYLIVSAPAVASRGFQLHRWSGEPASPPSTGVPLPEALNVQSLIVSDDGKRLLLFSDDSDVRLPVESADLCRGKLDESKTCPCARVEGQGPKRFRARWVTLDSLDGSVATP